MVRLALLIVCLAASGPAAAYSGVADVTLSWGETANPISWSWRLPNALTTVANETLFSSLPGSNQVSYFNSDFATGAGCSASAPGGAANIVARKYGCQYQGASGLAFFPLPAAPTDVGPAGAQATGTLYFTDTTLTGQLAVGVTTDEPTGGTAASTGDGAGAFNLRTEDTSVYGNAWYGASTAATLAVDLTGTFTAAGWEITGGTVRFTDPGFQCQQGGIGGGGSVLCSPTSSLPGTYSADGSHLSFGMDANGGVAGGAMTGIDIWDEAGTTVVATLSGVLASLTVGPGGVLATTSGEYRSGRGDGDTCASKLRWNGDRLLCGTLTVGPLQIAGTATPVDTEPDAFAFPAVADVPLATPVTSAAATITGIAAPARITVAGGQYSIGCTGSYTAAAANIPEGSTVCVRHTSSASPGTETVTTLDVGGVTATFTSTTVPADTTPDAFAFDAAADVDAGTVIVSAAVTLSGTNGPAPISVTGGEYSTGCSGAFTATAGSLDPGATVCVRHTSAATPLTPVVTTLTVGGVSGTFTSTTAAAPPDVTPDAFVFADQADVALAAEITSGPVTITGIDAPATVVVAGGSYSVGCTGPYVSGPGTLAAGQTVCVRHTSAAANATAVTTTLTVGGVSDGFTSTTVAAVVPPDTTPDPFAFVDQSGVATSAVIASAPVTITGLTGAATVTVTGGEYSVGCGSAFVATAGSINNGESVCVRHASSASASTSTSTTLTVGGVTDTFTSTTDAAVPPDTTPDPFSFTDQAGVALGTLVTSGAITIAGISAPAAIAVTGGEYAIGCGAVFTATAGMIAAGQTVCVRHLSSAINGVATSTTLTVGAISDVFTSTTLAADGGDGNGDGDGSGGSGGSGGGGGALDPWLLGLLAGLPAWRRRRRPV